MTKPVLQPTLQHRINQFYMRVVPYNVRESVETFFSRPIVWIALVALAVFVLWPESEEKIIERVEAETPLKSVELGAWVSGHPIIKDGDTLIIDDIRVTFYGADAFEEHQSCQTGSGRTTYCGDNAKAHLEHLINGEKVKCEVTYVDENNNPFAQCHTDYVADLGARMVHDGMAVLNKAHRQIYAAQEISAAHTKTGAWSGFFITPDFVRRGGAPNL
jgi:endonuclease YncB( thermonuclease family)